MRRIDLRITSWGHVRATLYQRIGSTDFALKTWETQKGLVVAFVYLLRTRLGRRDFLMGNYTYRIKMIDL